MKFVRYRLGLLVAVAALFTFTADLARAEDPRLVRTSRRVLECQDGEVAFSARIMAKKLTTISLPDTVADIVAPPQIRAERSANTVTTKKRSNEPFLGDVRITTRACTAYVGLWQADSIASADMHIQIKKPRMVPVAALERLREKYELKFQRLRKKRDKQQQALASLALSLEKRDQALDEREHRLDEREDRLNEQASGENWLGALMRNNLEVGRIEQSIVAPPAPADSDVQLSCKDFIRSDAKLVAFTCIIDNNSGADYPLATVRILNEGKTIDHAGRVVLPEQFASPDRELIGTIPPRTRVVTAVYLEHAEHAQLPLTVEIAAPSGLRAAMVRVWDLKLERADQAPETEVSLHLQAMGGAIWLADAIGLGELDPTTMKGLGARVTYGFNRWVAFEAELMGASTGHARFAGVAYNDTQGQLVRSATLGRVTLGGALRFGKEIIPTVRLGVGLQGASHDAEFTPDGGGAAQEPDVGFEFGALWYFGAGLDVRLGDNVLVGTTFSFDKLVSSPSQSLEAGVHLGYAWNP